MTGDAGTLIEVHTFETDTDLTPSSYYLDDLTPEDIQCTGDEVAGATSGHWIMDDIPATDPRYDEYSHLMARRTYYYVAP